RGSRRERRTHSHRRVEVGEVAVRPRLAVRRLHGEAGAAALVPAPREENRAVREGVERRAFRGDDVGGRGGVVVGRYREDGGAAADGEDVIAGCVGGGAGENLAGWRVERGSPRLVLELLERLLRRVERLLQAIRIRLRRRSDGTGLGGVLLLLQTSGKQALGV